MSSSWSLYLSTLLRTHRPHHIVRGDDNLSQRWVGYHNRPLWDSLGAISIIWISGNLSHMGHINWRVKATQKDLLCWFVSHPSLQRGSGQSIKTRNIQNFWARFPYRNYCGHVSLRGGGQEGQEGGLASVWERPSTGLPCRVHGFTVQGPKPVHGITMQGPRVHCAGVMQGPRVHYNRGSVHRGGSISD